MWVLQPIFVTVARAQSLHEENKTPKIKFMDIYKGNTEWSKAFFKADKELDLMNDNIHMSIKAGFHQIELIC